MRSRPRLHPKSGEKLVAICQLAPLALSCSNVPPRKQRCAPEALPAPVFCTSMRCSTERRWDSQAARLPRNPALRFDPLTESLRSHFHLTGCVGKGGRDGHQRDERGDDPGEFTQFHSGFELISEPSHQKWEKLPNGRCVRFTLLRFLMWCGLIFRGKIQFFFVNASRTCAVGEPEGGPPKDKSTSLRF